MKIASISIHNFLGARAVEVDTSAPVQLFAGANYAGKSSIRDAIALAITGDLGRVGTKKEAPLMISDGADAAHCEVRDGAGQAHIVSITSSGKVTSPLGAKPTEDPTLGYVLDAQTFASLKPDERRAFLFGLMGLSTDGPSVIARLIAKGHDKARVERVAVMLRAGFEAASKAAKEKATEAKAAWRTVTGEAAWGSEKGKAWKSSIPKRDDNLPTLQTELKHCDTALEQWQQQVGKLAAEGTRRAELRAKLPPLQEQVERGERIRKKLAVDEAELKRLDELIATTTAAAGAGPRVGLIHDLAADVDYLVELLADVDYDVERATAIAEHLEAYEALHGTLDAVGSGDPDAAARLPALRQAHATCTSAVANDRRDLDVVNRAAAEVESINTDLATEFDEAGHRAAVDKVAELKAERAAVQAKIDTANSLKQQAEQAQKKTDDAARHHADVVAWDALGDDLGPAGIPGEILAEALGPFNERLQQASDDTTWPLVAVDADMRITYGGRPFALTSESEQYRCEAMLAEAIAFKSGLKLLVLDRFDVLDLPGRAQLLDWLDVLVENGEIESAFLFATLKQLPTGWPAIAKHWVANGVLGQLKEAA